MNIQMPKKNMLIVDDDPVFRTVMKRTCEKYPFNVMTCASLREIQAATGGAPFDIVVMDYFLDNLKYALTGVELASVLEHLPVILVSSSDHCVDEYETWPLSIRAFYNKRIGADAIARAALNISKSPGGSIKLKMKRRGYAFK